jgi:hypothetical protein
MQNLMIRAVRVSFDKLPTPVKIIVYGGVTSIFVLLINDIDALGAWWGNYATIILGVLVNILSWLVLNLREED